MGDACLPMDVFWVDSYRSFEEGEASGQKERKRSTMLKLNEFVGGKKKMKKKEDNMS